MKITARSTPNIALIKYWGNRNNELRLPAADSLSMTLDQPHVDVTVEHSERFQMQSFDGKGQEKKLTEKQIQRIEHHLALTKQYLLKLGLGEALPDSVSLQIHSGILSGIGLASSAAVFSCLARAYAGIVEPIRKLTEEEMSVIGRLGSGSAARSIYGGFSALLAGTGDAIDAAKAVPIAPASHWNLHDIVIIPSRDEKKVGSTEGHALVHTSPLFPARIEAIRSRRQQQCIEAILEQDFEQLQDIAEEDALDMHHVMETSTPSIQYLTEDTYKIINGIEYMRSHEKVSVLYTMDAGPTVHAICTDESVQRMREFAHAQNGCTVFEAKVGPGASLL